MTAPKQQQTPKDPSDLRHGYGPLPVGKVAEVRDYWCAFWDRKNAEADAAGVVLSRSIRARGGRTRQAAA